MGDLPQRRTSKRFGCHQPLRGSPPPAWGGGDGVRAKHQDERIMDSTALARLRLCPWKIIHPKKQSLARCRTLTSLFIVLEPCRWRGSTLPRSSKYLCSTHEEPLDSSHLSLMSRRVSHMRIFIVLSLVSLVCWSFSAL